MITSIRLVNWRSHADTRLEFRKGTNLLVGIMGAGKSSILEGMSFALFGTFPALERRKLKLENIVRLSEAQSKVVMEFDWDGSKYRVERIIERSKHGAASHSEIYKDGKLAEHSTSAVNAYIEQLTGVDYDLFTRAIYSEQNNIDHFLNLDPRRRKEELDRLLGLDKFELARSNIVSVINRIKSKRETISERFSKDRLNELEVKEKSHADEASASEAALKNIESQSEKLAEEYSALIAKYELMKKNKDTFERLQREDLRLNAQAEAIQKELEGKIFDETILVSYERKLAEVTAERSRLQVAIKASDEKNTILLRELGSIDAKIKSASDSKIRLEALDGELKKLLSDMSPEDLAKKQKETEQSLLSAESELKSLEREAADLAETMRSLKPGLSQCPVCHAELTDSGMSHIKGEKEAMIKKRKERSAELSLSILSGKKDNDSLILVIRKASMLSEKIAALAQDLLASEGLFARKTMIETDHLSLSKEKKEIENKVELASAECERLRTEVLNLKALSSRKKEAETIGKSILEIKSQMATVKFDSVSFEETRTTAEKMRLENEKLNSEKRTAESRLRLCSEMLKTLRDELQSMRATEKEISGLYSLEEQLLIYRNALADTQVNLRTGLSEAINSAMNEIWTIFYPYRNFHGLRLFVTDKDYVFEVNDGNGWRSLETIASGGERASAALALRVALAMILTPKLSWLILDEPTHNLDSEAVELLSSALQFKVPQVVKQTFVITHDEAFMGSDFAASYRLSRDKDKNGETKIEPM